VASPSRARFADAPEAIVVEGAREHNLRNLDLRIPRDQLVVITGLSGSGKSSLAFDTLYAEGQRRYVESLSTYARQFLDQMRKPDVDSIEGLSPAISIEQKTVSRNPRSTVGTATEIYDFLRLLFARAGEPHCFRCGRPIASQTVDQMADRVLGAQEGARVQILAPVLRGRKGAHKKELEHYRRQGYVRVRVDGEMLDLSDEINLARQSRHDIEVVIDRLVAKESARLRVAESLGTALGLAQGLALALIESPETGEVEEVLFSEANACVECGVSYPELAPRMFSFNSPAGACPDCGGLGTLLVFDPERVVPDPSLSLAEGAIEPWRRGRGKRYYAALLAGLARHLDFALHTPWNELSKKVRQTLLLGKAGEIVQLDLPRAGREESFSVEWRGVVEELERRAQKDEKTARALARYRLARPCDTCKGSRLRTEARNVRIGGKPIHELCRLSCLELSRFLDGLRLEGARAAVGERVLAEIRERLGFLNDVGLGYLSLDRRSATLSGGEGQRIRLATQIGTSLMGVVYILDEPSIGLHPRDHARLLDSLDRLKEMGNSVVVVEHDEATIRRADHVIDMGPGAGTQGGEIVAQGSPSELEGNPNSRTGAFLSGRESIPIPPARRSGSGKRLVLEGCSEHNLKDLDLSLPLETLTVVSGVSGSGKSTLVNDTLHRALARRLHDAELTPGVFEKLTGIEHLDRVIAVDQAPIGRTPRSNPATYSGAFDGIRKLFAQIPEARARGYDAGRFSFNVKGGRCEACRGDGLLRVEMNFLPDLFVTCEVCRGRRYTRDTLEVRYRGRNVAEVLAMTVSEAQELFEKVPAIHRPLQTLAEVGLGYLSLGQPATTLSGGEAQRIKLARELARRSSGRTLYLLDEPTTGLHFADVAKLLDVLQRLVERGSTVVVIEHHPDVIKCADHVIDLGPEGGEAGGELVVQGTPEEVAACSESHTGVHLAEALRGPEGAPRDS